MSRRVERPIVLHSQCPETRETITRHLSIKEWRYLIKRQGIKFFGPSWGVLFDRYAGRCESFEVGRNRVTFLFRTYVVKLPIAYGGVGDNDWEGSVSNIPGEKGYIQFARTRLYYKGEMPILFMERLELAYKADIEGRLEFYPDWVNSVDCGQVGFSRAGKLLAYDWGYN